MAQRIPTQCDQCGKLDTAPKVHLGAVTKHHDCLAVAEKNMVVESSDVAAGIIEACEGGLRNDELLAHIEAVHTEAK